MSSVPPDLAPIHLRPNSLKEKPMEPDVSNPANGAIKPGLSTSEGKIALLVVVVTTLGPVVTALAGAMPDNPWAQVALASLAAVASLLTALGYLKKRTDAKETANNRAADLAAHNTTAATAIAFADKAIGIAKDHPELAVALLKSAGITPPDPPKPASS